MTHAIEIRNLVKDYGSLRAVDQISLDIPQGSFFALLGENGAGKSTTIHVVTGLANRTSGEVRVFGKDVSQDYLECRRRIGLAPQEFNFDMFFPIQKILEFQGGYFGLSAKKSRARAEELLKTFGLWEKRNVKSTALSGGLKKRLLMIKAMVHEPDILILDEPTAGVDVSLRHQLWDYLKKLNEAGRTIVLTTHYIEEAEKLCDEIAIMHKGMIAKRGNKTALLGSGQGTLEDLFLNYVDRGHEETVA